MRYWPQTWLTASKTFAPSRDCANADFVLYFGGREAICSPSLYSSLRSNCPKASILGCSSDTVICGADLSDHVATAVAVQLDRSSVELASVPLVQQSSYDAGRSLGAQLSAQGLVGVLILSDGLNVNGSSLVAGLQSVLGGHIPIGGGLAADGAAFAKTFVGADGVPEQNLAAALGFYGQAISIRIGAAHGWDFFGPTRRVTRSEGPVLYEMDGKPALDLYVRYLGEEAADLPASALLYPLLITNPKDARDEVVRTVLAVDHDKGTMTFAGDVPEGWSARLMLGDFDNLTRGAAAAAEQARENIEANGDALAVLISCIGRRLLMKQHTADEVEATAAALSENVHQIGFYSYGEIATQGVGGQSSFHNQTMTVMMIEETV